MEAQVTRPRVQHRGEAHQAAEALLVAAQRQQRLAARREEDVEDAPPVPHRQRRQLVVGHREDDVEVVGGQQPGHAALNPPRLRQGLARGAVPVAA
jgi:hypothetical protein